MTVFDPNVEEAGPAWTRHNLSDHDDVFTANADHLADLVYNARIGAWVPNHAISAPAIAYAAGAGTSPVAGIVLGVDSNDDRGVVTFSTGSAPPAQSAGQPLLVFTFGVPIITPQPATQPLLSPMIVGATTAALNPKLPLPPLGTVVTLAGGTSETLTVSTINYATGVVTFTGGAANAHAAGSAANWSVAKIPYIDIQETNFASRNLLMYPSAITAAGFTVSYAGTTIAASQSGTFAFMYKVEG